MSPEADKSDLNLDPLSQDKLCKFIDDNYAIIEKLRGKKRSVVRSAVSQLMRKANI